MLEVVGAIKKLENVDAVLFINRMKVKITIHLTSALESQIVNSS